MSYNQAGALRFIEENDVKFVRLQFCDILGNLKNISISPRQLSRAFDEGIAFDASSIKGFSDIEDSELFLFPDPSTLRILPWRPQHGKVARIFCDIRKADGSLFIGDSRNILKKVFEYTKKQGFVFQVGPECEFYLFKMDQEGHPILNPADTATYFDVAPLDLGENIRRELCLTLESMGFDIESSHHESGAGQHEVDFKYTDMLTAADNILTFKNVVSTISYCSGYHASFMPKPLENASGSGMHINMSLSKDGENVFKAKHNEGMPEIAQHFIAGILAHIKEITAVTNPTINSYKRLRGGKEAPGVITWSYNNRSTLIRVPSATYGHDRIELRSPDPSCNPYLALCLILAAGIEGVQKALPLPKACTTNTYKLSEDDIKSMNLEKLPTDLKDSLDIMKNSQFCKDVLGDKVFHSYIELKEAELDAFYSTVHEWEIQNYL